MKKLLKNYGFNSIQEYFNYIEESYVNGQPQQAKELFLAMPKIERKNMVKAFVSGCWDNELRAHNKLELIDLI